MMSLINAACCAANVAMFAAWGYWWNLAAAVFCGLIAIIVGVIEVTR